MRYFSFIFFWGLNFLDGAALAQAPPSPTATPVTASLSRRSVVLFGIRGGVTAESFLGGGNSAQIGGFVEWLTPVQRLDFRLETMYRREWLQHTSESDYGTNPKVTAVRRYRSDGLRITPLVLFRLLRPDHRGRWISLMVGPSFPVSFGKGTIRGERLERGYKVGGAGKWAAIPCDTTYSSGSRPGLVAGIGLHLSPALDIALRMESGGSRPYYSYSNGGLFGTPYVIRGRSKIMALNLSVGYRFNSPRIASQ
ncbi:MAG: hypothetical protein H7330_12560 [Hymenobacteraceae bacterium]|nr:hypothetical protein [Hymenobacteraceae bacterium]